MQHLTRLLGAAALALTACCAVAADTARLDGYVVHYAAYNPTSKFAPSLPPALDVEAGPSRGVVTIAVRRPSSDDTLAQESVPADVEGTVRNLLGQQEALAFSEVTADGYRSYVAGFDMAGIQAGRWIARFRIEIRPQGESKALVLEFEESLAPPPGGGS